MSNIYEEDENGERRSITLEEARRIFEEHRKKRKDEKKLEDKTKTLEEEKRRALGSAIRAREEIKTWEDRETQERAHESFQKSYGEGSVAVVRPGGVQTRPEKPPPTRLGTILVPVKVDPYEGKVYTEEKDIPPARGYRRKRRK